MTRPTEAATARPAEATRIVGRDGRAKAYRPLPEAERTAAIAAGLAAYDRGDFFLAHEDLEPAWMGTADLGERAVLQGLIKLAAAYVHAVRGNPPGIQRNLVGARHRLGEPGAVLMPMSTFTARLSELPTDRPLLVICHSGGRSAAVTSFLVRAGRGDVTNVVGGMEAWSAAGLPTRLGPVTPGEGDLPAE
jgi:rhodanese-related sulfurtransferase